MNANESSQPQPFGYPPCGSYDAQLWTGWRQDACYPPYYVGNDPSFPCNSSSTLMNHQRFEFPLMHSHHPAFGLPQTMQTLHPSTSSAASSVEPTSSTSLPSSHQIERASSSYNSADSTNQPTSSTKPEASLQVDSPKDRHSSMKDDIVSESSHVKQEATSSDCSSSKKKRDRFNGLTEEDVLKRTVPDLLFHNLDIIIIGSCPGLTAAYLGHHYAGPGNHFWKCLYLSGLIPEPMNASDDYKLKQFGIGFTNFVARCTKGSVEFSRREIKEGIESLTEKIQSYKPKIAVFNGKGIYEVFCNHKNFYIGKQPEPFPGTNTVVYVMPSSSARCSQLPRASDKVPFFVALRKLRDHLMGCLPHLDESEIVFPDLDLKVEPRKDRRPSEEVQNQSQVRPNSRDDRKRKMSECPSSGFNEMMVAQRMMYRGFMPHQDFNRWGSAGCFPGWHAPIPLPPSHPHQYSNYDAAFSSMGKVPYTTDPCGFFRNIHPSPFYPAWSPETQHAHHRWAMHPPFPGASSVPDPRYNISPYFQPFAPADVLSAAALVGAAKPDVTSQSSSFPSHFSDSCRPPMYQDPSIFSPEMYPSDQIKSQFQTPAFLQRPIINNPTSSSSASYHSSQYR